VGRSHPITYSLFTDYEDDVYERVTASGTDLVTKANSITEKADRNAALDEATASIMGELESEFPDRGREIKAAVRSLTKKIVRTRIVEEGIRIDGRGTSDLRPLSAEVDLFPTAHGSASSSGARPRS
jgi:polyribonucleotide nucleotidyltransferase